jgi:hypothetical protein
MLKKSTSFVLARSKPQRTARVRLGFSLTAAALDGLFEHPVVYSGVPSLISIESSLG